MRNLLDLSWDSLPHDGASAPTCPSAPADHADDEELMYAWLCERQENIEMGLFLERACELLGRIASGGEVTPSVMRRARDLIRAIDEARLANRDGSGRSHGTL